MNQQTIMNNIETGIYQIGCVGSIVINESDNAALKDFGALWDTAGATSPDSIDNVGNSSRVGLQTNTNSVA
jgi:hypothetical protein